MDDLTDPFLALAADMLDDLETVRVANDNRLRQLTRPVGEADADGEYRGFGLPEDHPTVQQFRAIAEAIGAAEHQAELALGRQLRRHPLHPWIKAQHGVGDKQGARLLAALGDPYLRPDIEREDGTVEAARPRRVSELWAYAGYHVIPTGHRQDTHTLTPSAGGEQSGGDPGQSQPDIHAAPAGVAAHRRRGTRVTWNPTVRMRAHLVAAKCVMQADGTPWRDTYTAAREKYAGAVHRTECPRCGPKGKPAQPGSPLSAGHQHARAVRIVAKALLRELWREAGRLHGDDTSPPAPRERAA